MPFFGQELFERAQAKGPLTDPAYRKARDERAASRRQGRAAGRARSRHARCHHRAEHVAGMADRSSCSAIISSAPATAWLRSPERPASRCPSATCSGLPLGLTIMGRAYDENGIIALAYCDRAEDEGAQRAAVQADSSEADDHDPNIRVACPQRRRHHERHSDGPTDTRRFTISRPTRCRASLPISRAYRGKVTLVVNTASECGYTPQYEGLEALHRELSPKGFSVLGFPEQRLRRPGAGQRAADRRVLPKELRRHLSDVRQAVDPSRSRPVADLHVPRHQRPSAGVELQQIRRSAKTAKSSHSSRAR